MGFIIKFFQCLFSWKVEMNNEEEIRNADVVLGQAFGLRKFSPGKSNEALAKIARKLHQRFNLPLVLQWEIAECLPDLPIAEVVREHRLKGKYLDTFEMLFQIRVMSGKHGWERAVVLAHPHHHWRCMMVAKRLGFDVLVVDVSSVPYDKLSTQWWTRDALRFIPREIVARLIFLFTGKI